MRTRPFVRLATVAAGAALVAGLCSPAGGVTEDADADGYGTVRNILPPGQSGTVNATDLARVLAGDPTGRVARDGENAPKNFADQLEMYDALTTKRPGSLSAEDLDSLFKDSGFTPKKVSRETRPRPGVVIQWDGYGVPYIHGATYADTTYGAGYAGTLDRMFLMDVLRHAGRAELAAFAGATEDNLAMDQNQLRTAFYTEKQAKQQITKAAERYGEEGERLLRAVDAFLEGVNDAQEALCPHGSPVAPKCPAEYAALQKKPQPWTRADVVYVASLVGGIFGKGGGAEAANAIWLQRLTEKFGQQKGRRIYRDLRHKNDADAPTTATTRTPYGGGRLDPDRPGVALPDVDAKTAPGTGAPIDGTDAPLPELGDLLGESSRATMDTPLGSIDVPIASHGASNALLVSGKHTDSGRPLAVFGPQTGYYTPQLLTEQVLDGPGIKARGVAFAGTNLFVQLGRGLDYAWSATSAGSDVVDTVVERLCNVDGSEPTVHSTGYRVGGSCRPMQRYEHTYTALPNLAAPEPPEKYTYLVLRTRHGLVQQRTTVDGEPVALVHQRSTYGHEVDSVVGFARFNDPGYVHDADSFQKAAGAIDYTFNWFYVDAQDISYYSSGRLPIRSDEVDFDLPHWGEDRYDWQGWLPFSEHVHQTNPDRGYLVSWNNKTAPGFAAGDGVWGHGSVHRSQALEDRLTRTLSRGDTVEAAEVTGIMSGAATADVRARHTLPWLLKAIGDDPHTADARRLLRAWARDGAPRVDRGRDGHYSHEQAIALFDEWWQSGKESVAYDVLGGRLGHRLARKLPEPVDNHPRLGQGSAWNNIAWYGYVNKDLRSLLGDRVEQPYAYRYCGRGRLQQCRADLRASLRDAVTRIKHAQDVDDVADLTYDKSQDAIRGVTAGVVGVRPIDWQNRPTFQQLVAFSRHR